MTVSTDLPPDVLGDLRPRPAVGQDFSRRYFHVSVVQNRQASLLLQKLVHRLHSPVAKERYPSHNRAAQGADADTNAMTGKKRISLVGC